MPTPAGARPAACAPASPPKSRAARAQGGGPALGRDARLWGLSPHAGAGIAPPLGGAHGFARRWSAPPDRTGRQPLSPLPPRTARRRAGAPAHLARPDTPEQPNLIQPRDPETPGYPNLLQSRDPDTPGQPQPHRSRDPRYPEVCRSASISRISTPQPNLPRIDLADRHTPGYPAAHSTLFPAHPERIHPPPHPRSVSSPPSPKLTPSPPLSHPGAQPLTLSHQSTSTPPAPMIIFHPLSV